jgi:hypothetical protein
VTRPRVLYVSPLPPIDVLIPLLLIFRRTPGAIFTRFLKLQPICDPLSTQTFRSQRDVRSSRPAIFFRKRSILRQPLHVSMHRFVGIATRVVSGWLEKRGFGTRLIERFLDRNYRRSNREPVIALSGFDDNEARQWLARAGVSLIFDSGLGGEVGTFDSVAVQSWPNRRPAADLWPSEHAQARRETEERTRRRAERNEGYDALAPDECGRVLVAGKSVAVPFVGAVSSAFVLAEMLRTLNAGPAYYDARFRVCALSEHPLIASLRTGQAEPVSGIHCQQLVCS